MEPGIIVKAVYDFATEESGELSLQVADVIQVLKKVDKQWSFGFSNGREGNFPCGFTIEVKVPILHDGEELFAAVGDFIAQEFGDLSFKKGDLIVGTLSIDNNWWRGLCNGQNGIFPVSHVWKLDRSTLITAVSPKKLNLKARVRMNMKAQLKAEMDLIKDEIILITEEVDKGWYRGECNGRSGIFPSAFVTLLSDIEDEAVNPEIPSCAISHNVSNGEVKTDLSETRMIVNPLNDQYGYDCLNSGITAYGRTLYPFRSEYPNELSFKDGEIVNLIRYVDEKWMEGEMDGKVGIFPKDFIDIIVDCPAPDPKVVENESISTETQPKIFMFPLDTYGRVLYDFHPQVEGDIALKEGDTVTLVREIDKNWCEITTDNGDIGLCPSNFLEVIGAAPETSPPSYTDVMRAINYDNQIFSDTNYNVSDSNSRTSNYSATNLVPHHTISNNQYLSNSLASSRNEVLYCASNPIKEIGNKMSDNLCNINKSEPASDSHSIACDEKKYNINYSEFSGRGNLLQTPMSHSSEEFQIGSCGRNIEASLSHSGKTATRTQKATPVRPPPPTIIWPSRQDIVITSSTTMSPEAAPRLSLKRQSSLTDSGGNLGIEQSYLHEEIAAKEEQIKRLESCRSKLEQELDDSHDKQDFVSNEIRRQINEFAGEIAGIKNEIQTLRGGHQKHFDYSSLERKVEPTNREAEVQRKKELEEKRRHEERLKKIKEQRQCVITEILQTERDYIGDMKILHTTFLQNPEEGRSKGIDMSTLFGNLEEIIDTAGRLLKRLQKTANAKEENQMIGECFTDMADEMKEVYGHYCRNHDDVNAVLDEYEETSPGGQYLKHKFELMKRQTNCFDLPSMLIKPVQRILKYPLLLNELVKCTGDEHPDKQSLIKAVVLMTDVATAINEFKRKKDLVFKYRKHADTSLSGRISKLNFHSMLKKSSRFGMRLSNTIGLTSVIKDETFEKLLKKFNALEKAINIFLKDICTYAEKVQELITTAFNMAEDIAEVYQERRTQPEVDEFRSAHRMILSEFYEVFKHSIPVTVIDPLQQLLKTYHGPNNLIRKREDKLLDYESCSNKLEKNKDVTKIKMLQDNLSMAKNTYEALNSQLLDDLPKLCSISTDILRDCILCFLRARKNFVGKTARQMLGLMELPLMLGSQGGILEIFQVKHNLVIDHLCQLSIVPRNLFPSAKTGSLKKSASPRNFRSSLDGSSRSMISQAVQNSSQKAYVLSSHPQSQLYSACQNYTASDLLDISLKKDDVVGVIKYQDPMGSKLKWFVDNGVSKGFVSAKVLVKYISEPSQDFHSPVSSMPTQDLFQTIERNTSSQRCFPPQKCFNSIQNAVTGQSLRDNRASPPPAYSISQKQITQSSVNAKSYGLLQPSRPAPSIQGRNESVQKIIASDSLAFTLENSTSIERTESQRNIIPIIASSGQLSSRSMNIPSEQLNGMSINTPLEQPSQSPITRPRQLNRTPVTVSSTQLNRTSTTVFPAQLNITTVPSGHLTKTATVSRELSQAAMALGQFSRTTTSSEQPSRITTVSEKPKEATVTAPYRNKEQIDNSQFPLPMNIAPRYEEIDDLHDSENQYNVIANDVQLISENSESSPARNRYSSILLDEFDPCSPKESADVFYDDIPDYSTATDLYNMHRYEDIPGDNCDVQIESTCLEYYFALYDFIPMGQNQLKLAKGQVVLVVHKCDLNQNADWWFVEDRYQNKGYVPSSYLMRYSEQVAQY